MINRIELEGRLGQEPEIRFTHAGQKVATLNIANTRHYKQGENWKTETMWIKCQLWGRLADKAGNLQKGDHVLVIGRLQKEEWETQHGKRHTYSIVAEDLRTVDFVRKVEEIAKDMPENDYPDDVSDVPF